jgi:KaiC/GvpD/RAD55 family RecA-like ATPase
MKFRDKRAEQLGINSIGSLKRSGKVSGKLNPALFIHGPEEFDCLHNRWSRAEVFGIVGDSSSGKSEVALYCLIHILMNNPESCVIYVSLEMTSEKVAKRLYEMVNGDEDILERFFVISRYDDEGKSRAVSMDFIKKECRKYRDTIGDVAAIAIDHIHCLGENDPSTLNSIMITLKEIAVEFNTFVIALAQVNKGAGQKGEVPLDADAVLGCSQFKYICSDIIQLHRPILRFEEEAKMSVLGYGYCKIRESHPSDKMKKLQNKLLKYVPETRSFKKMDTGEYTIFKLYYKELLDLKSAEERSKSYAYDITKEVEGPNGKKVTINEKFTGE